MDDEVSEGPTARPAAHPTTTHLLWSGVVGERLEQLVWALVDDMGATSMLWRAGTTSGVTASDGGRDIEATFTTPSAEGEPVVQRWWFEAKGRTSTVRRSLVTEAVHNAAAYDIDVFVMCTNSIFANSAHDWAREWNRSHDKPEVLLWDRENLSAMVRRAPVVAARVLPELLTDSDRLSLLLERYLAIGELPSFADLIYFWERSDQVTSHPDVVRVVEMFLCAEDEVELVRRPWTALLPTDQATALKVIAISLCVLPQRIFLSLPRPVDPARTVRVCAHLFVSVVERLPSEVVAEAAKDPSALLEGEPWGAAAAEAWREHVLKPVFGQVQDEMGSICGHDCARVSTERSAFPAEVGATEYFRRFQLSEGSEGGTFLAITDLRAPCAVGLDLPDNECIVERQVAVDERFVRELQRVLEFRRANPTGQYLKFSRHGERTADGSS